MIMLIEMVLRRYTCLQPKILVTHSVKREFQQILVNLISLTHIRIFHVSPQILEYKVFFGWGDIFLRHSKYLVQSPQ